jgi:hypothetical protein
MIDFGDRQPFATLAIVMVQVLLFFDFVSCRGKSSY